MKSFSLEAATFFSNQVRAFPHLPANFSRPVFPPTLTPWSSHHFVLTNVVYIPSRRLTLTSKAWRALYHQFLDEIDLSTAGAHKIVNIPQVMEVLFASSNLSTSGSSRTPRVSMSDRPTPRTTQQKITSIYFCKRNLTDDQEKILMQVAERFTNVQSLVLSGCFRLEDRTIHSALAFKSSSRVSLLFARPAKSRIRRLTCSCSYRCCQSRLLD
jgi:hypothetical protein